MSRPEPKPPAGVLVPNLTPEVTDKAQNDDKPFDFFSGAMKTYWETGLYSDLVISVKGYNIRAHRMIVSSQSIFLSYLVHDLHVRDKKAKTIKIPDRLVTNVNAIKAMIAWMYGVDYMTPGIERKPHVHAGMYELGIRFGIARLSKYALQKVKESADVPDAEFDPKTFVRLVSQEFCKSNASLRILLVDICRRKIELLLKEPEFGDVLKSHRYGFAPELMKSLGRNEPEVHCLECGWFCNKEGRCLDEFCISDEDWRAYFC